MYVDGVEDFSLVEPLRRNIRSQSGGSPGPTDVWTRLVPFERHMASSSIPPTPQTAYRPPHQGNI